MSRQLRHLLLMVLLAATLSGCGGWHLRGTDASTTHKFSKVFLKGDVADQVTMAVRRELYNRGLKVVTKRNNADLVIEIEDERFERRILSVDPGTGKVREIELGLLTHFTVRSADGRLLVQREPLTFELDYVFDEGSLLGTVEQDNTVQQDLAETAATSLVFRLESIELPPPAKAAPKADPKG
jgi:outer membrane lipopolysaccharide assembly protein LptE/RlpB